MKLLWFFAFFFISGFCSVMYEVIWLRLGMAHFGVTTPLISIFLSIFMAGLGLGSWACGKVAAKIRNPLRAYALVELLIAISAITVPTEMAWANRFLDTFSAQLSISSGRYYVLASGLLALILLPWCTAMGATFPLAMAAIRGLFPTSEKHFSFLYLANVCGAVFGAFLPAFFFIELLGFRRSLILGATLNLFIVIGALLLRWRSIPLAQVESCSTEAQSPSETIDRQPRRFLFFLFLTGLLSMAMEVVWIRQFTPYVGTQVYAFATILAMYLAGTFAGLQIYRRWIRYHQLEGSEVPWAFMGVAALIPLVSADPRLPILPEYRVLLSIVPFTALVGFITPMLVDCFSQDRPVLAGRAYAINLLGCIIGPLLSGFLLLPWLGERGSLMVMSLPLFALVLVSWRSEIRKQQKQFFFYAATAAVALSLVFGTIGFEELYNSREVRRDYAATVISTGAGMDKHLIVNGTDMTSMTPLTKFMAHLPLAFLDRRPQNALVICFGMGTTFRSLLSWGIDATAVELLPSVPRAFHYYHSDGDRLLQSSRAHVVIDDGRLFLQRTNQQFDLITVDPPPPIQAAGSSLLYSREFYAVLKKRLKPGGILQQWFPGGDCNDSSAIAKALKQSFPYVRVFAAFEGEGFHFMATNAPTANRSAAELAGRLPQSAAADLVEWGPKPTAEEQFRLILSKEVSLDSVIARAPHAPVIEDDRAINEYLMLREWSARDPGNAFAQRLADFSFPFARCGTELLTVPQFQIRRR